MCSQMTKDQDEETQTEDNLLNILKYGCLGLVIKVVRTSPNILNEFHFSLHIICVKYNWQKP